MAIYCRLNLPRCEAGQLRLVVGLTMKQSNKEIILMVGASLAGLILGTWSSVLNMGESAYSMSKWSQFLGSLTLSPILMTLVLPLSPFFPINCFGALICISSVFLGVKRRFPVPQWLMLCGSFLWSLGNATTMETIMGV